MTADNAIVDSSTQQPSVSVVISLCRKYDQNNGCIQSLLAQTRSPTEVIVVGNALNQEQKQQLKTSYGNNVRFLHRDGLCVRDARNIGLSRATGDYISYLDYCDHWSPHYLEQIDQLIRQYPNAGLLATAYQVIGKNRHFINPAIDHSVMRSNSNVLDRFFYLCCRGDDPFIASTVTLKKSVLTALGGYRLNDAVCMDHDVWARAATCSQLVYSSNVMGFCNLEAREELEQASLLQHELDFSKNLSLTTYAKQTPPYQPLRSDILDYCAHHLIRLARRHIAYGNLSVAQRILKNKRCNRLIRKKWLALAQLLIAQYRSHLPAINTSLIRQQ